MMLWFLFFSNLHTRKVTWFQAYYSFSSSNIHQIPVSPSRWFVIHPVLAFFPPLAPQPLLHPSNKNLFSCLSLPVIPSSLSSPSILYLLLMVISLPTLSVLFPWHGYWQQQTSVIFTFIVALAFPVSFSSPSVLNPKPTAQIDTLPQAASCSPMAISTRIGSCACLGEEALSRQETTFLFQFLKNCLQVYKKWSWKESLAGALEEAPGVLWLWCVGELHEPLEYSQWSWICRSFSSCISIAPHRAHVNLKFHINVHVMLWDPVYLKDSKSRFLAIAPPLKNNTALIIKIIILLRSSGTLIMIWLSKPTLRATVFWLPVTIKRLI